MNMILLAWWRKHPASPAIGEFPSSNKRLSIISRRSKAGTRTLKRLKFENSYNDCRDESELWVDVQTVDRRGDRQRRTAERSHNTINIERLRSHKA
jgi:hypothetical protein